MRRVSVVGLCVLVCCGAAVAGARLEHDFDTGSLRPEGSRVEGSDVYLAGRDNYYGEERWKWFHFRLHGAEDDVYRFHISEQFMSAPERLDSKRPVYSYDGRRWEFFENASRNEGTYTFYNDEPFRGDIVHVAYSIPYPLERIERLVGWLRNDPYIHSTASGDGKLKIGRSSGGTDDLGREIPSHDLYGFRIAESAESGEKPVVVLIGGVHANEMLGNYVLEGLLLFLISEAPEAQALRAAADVLVYPMVNPDGRYAGYNRGGVQHTARDTNRFWHETLWGDMDDIRVVAEAIRRDVGGAAVPLFIDFHSFANTQAHFLYAHESLRAERFWERLVELEPEMALRRPARGREAVTDEEPERVVSRAWAEWELKAGYGITAESMVRPGENVDRFRRMGRAFGLAIHAHVVE